jgi:hypothetical protein
MSVKLDRLRVVVTASDIELGRRGTHCHCPIALAVRRLGFRYRDVCVDRESVDKGGEWKLPGVASQFVDDFDSARRVAPFAFYIQKKETP